MRPQRRRAASTIAARVVSLATSASKARHSPPDCRAIATVSSAEAKLLSTASTLAPSCAKRKTVAATASKFGPNEQPWQLFRPCRQMLQVPRRHRASHRSTASCGYRPWSLIGTRIDQRRDAQRHLQTKREPAAWNFLPDVVYRNICAHPEWARRLAKVHTGSRSALQQAGWREAGDPRHPRTVVLQ